MLMKANADYLHTVWVGCRSLRALERSGAKESEQESWYNSALAAGMETPEDYMEVALARLDAIRRQGPEKAGELRVAFQAVQEMLQVSFLAATLCLKLLGAVP